MWFDSHCHLDFEAFDADRSEVLRRAREAGVGRVFIPGVTPSQWPGLPELCAQWSGLCFGLGVHPWHVHRTETLEAELDALPRRCREWGAVAVGETGLDAVAAKRGGASLEQQARAFDKQLVVARELGLPLVLHVVRAHAAALEMLERHAPFPAGGVLHSYSGSAELLVRYLRLGLYVSFSGAVTHPASLRIRSAAAQVPEGRLLLETDAPDQPPVGFQSEAEPKRNEPRALPLVAQALAELRGSHPEALLDLASRNAARLYLGG